MKLNARSSCGRNLTNIISFRLSNEIRLRLSLVGRSERYLLAVGRQIVEYLVDAYANHDTIGRRRATDYMNNGLSTKK